MHHLLLFHFYSRAVAVCVFFSFPSSPSSSLAYPVALHCTSHEGREKSRLCTYIALQIAFSFALYFALYITTLLTHVSFACVCYNESAMKCNQSHRHKFTFFLFPSLSRDAWHCFRGSFCLSLSLFLLSLSASLDLCHLVSRFVPLSLCILPRVLLPVSLSSDQSVHNAMWT